MATRWASSRRNSCRSRRSKGQPSHLLSGIASWAFPWRGRETLPKAERTMIRASCTTILPHIARWPRQLDLGATLLIVSDCAFGDADGIGQLGQKPHTMSPDRGQTATDGRIDHAHGESLPPWRVIRLAPFSDPGLTLAVAMMWLNSACVR